MSFFADGLINFSRQEARAVNSPSPECLCGRSHKHATGIPAPAKCIITYFSIHFKGAASFLTFLSLNRAFDLNRFWLLSQLCGFLIPPRRNQPESLGFTVVVFSICNCKPEYVFAHAPVYFFCSYLSYSILLVDSELEKSKSLKIPKGCVQPCQTQTVACVNRAFQPKTCGQL